MTLPKPFCSVRARPTGNRFPFISNYLVSDILLTCVDVWCMDDYVAPVGALVSFLVFFCHRLQWWPLAFYLTKNSLKQTCSSGILWQCLDNPMVCLDNFSVSQYATRWKMLKITVIGQMSQQCQLRLACIRAVSVLFGHPYLSIKQWKQPWVTVFCNTWLKWFYDVKASLQQFHKHISCIAI